MIELPNLFAGLESQDKKFLVMVLSDCTVQAALASLMPLRADSDSLNEDVEVLQDVHLLYTSSVKDYDTPDEAVVAADRALQELGAESEDVTDVVFGFEPSWVSPAGIADDKKPLLKKLTTELSLKALGFVVTTEAVFQHLKDAEPLISTLVLCLTPTSVVVVVVKQGVMQGVETVGRSSDISSDVAEAIARFKQTKELPHVPPQFLVLAAGITESELVVQQQELINYDWITNQDFLQQPTVDTLSSKSLIEVVATQGGRAVLGAAVSPSSATNESTSPMQPEEQQAEPAKTVVTEGDNFGFVSLNTEQNDKAVASTFGVPVGKKAMEEWEQKHNGEAAEEVAEHTHAHKVPGATMPKMPHMPKVPGMSGLGKGKIGQFIAHHKLFVLLGFGLGVLTLVLLVGVSSSVFAKMSIVVTPKQQTVALDEVVRLSSAVTTSDPANKVLAATAVTKEVTGQANVAVGGIKVVGEPSKGKVTLANKTDSVKTFAAGTILSSGKLTFALDKEVTVASASVSKQGSEGETKTYGKAEGTVTARAVGEDGNLKKDTVLKVAEFASSTYEATVTDGLSGGSSREARVVSEQDRTKATNELKAKLVEQANAAWKQESGQGKYFAPTGKVTLKDTEYDKKVGDEAESLTIAATAVVEALSYEVSELEKLAAASLAQKVPAGFVLASGKPTVLSSLASPASSTSTTTTANIALNVNMSQQAQAQLDPTSWYPEILGVDRQTALARIAEKSGVQSATVTVQPSLLDGLVKNIPAKKENVEITVVAQ